MSSNNNNNSGSVVNNFLKSNHRYIIGTIVVTLALIVVTSAVIISMAQSPSSSPSKKQQKKQKQRQKHIQEKQQLQKQKQLQREQQQQQLEQQLEQQNQHQKQEQEQINNITIMNKSDIIVDEVEEPKVVKLAENIEMIIEKDLDIIVKKDDEDEDEDKGECEEECEKECENDDDDEIQEGVEQDEEQEEEQQEVEEEQFNMFGVSIEKLMEFQRQEDEDENNEENDDEDLSTKVPIVLNFMLDRIKNLGGFETEGLFRVNGNLKLVEQLATEGFDPFSDDLDTNVNTWASLLKKWIRELPEPIIPIELNQIILDFCTDNNNNSNNNENCNNSNSENCNNNSDKITSIINMIKSNDHKYVLYRIGEFFGEMLQNENVEKTKMNVESLSRILTPSLFKPANNQHSNSGSSIPKCLDLQTILLNQKKEIQFVSSLLSYFKDLYTNKLLTNSSNDDDHEDEQNGNDDDGEGEGQEDQE